MVDTMDTRQWIEMIATVLESTCFLVGAASVCFQDVILLHWLVQRFALHLVSFSYRYVRAFNRAACMVVGISFLVKNFRLCCYVASTDDQTENSENSPAEGVGKAWTMVWILSQMCHLLRLPTQLISFQHKGCS